MDFLYCPEAYDDLVMHAARDAGYPSATSMWHGAATLRGRYSLLRIAASSAGL